LLGRVTFWQEGVSPTANTTLPRSELVRDIIDAAAREEFVLLKGPPGCGKTSLLMILEHELGGMGRNVLRVSMPAVRDGTTNEDCNISAMEQMVDWIASLNRGGQLPSDPPGILLCDEIHRMYRTGFWDEFLKRGYLTKFNVRIIAAATRVYVAEHDSPVKIVKFSFDKLRLSDEEAKNLMELHRFGLRHLFEAFEYPGCQDAVQGAIIEQCAGHAFAIAHSLRRLDEAAKHEGNRSADKLIAELLSRNFANSYTRIWSESNQRIFRFGKVAMEELQAAFLNDTKEISSELQKLLNKMFITSCQDTTTTKTWATLKPKFLSPLTYRRFLNYLFPYGGDPTYKPNSIRDLVLAALGCFRKELVRNNNNAGRNTLAKEGGLQHMFYAALTEVLSPVTEVVSEMSAIMPERNGHGKGELDFYVNSTLFYGIELMRNGDRLQEHKERFKPGGKYFTPHIRDYVLVDFLRPGYVPRSWVQNRLVVVFECDFSGAKVLEGVYHNNGNFNKAVCLGKVEFK
jgi:energy-coupling factor transporter ATP-binding protein EcfA2